MFILLDERQENKANDSRKLVRDVKEKSINESESIRARRDQILPKFDPEKEQKNLSMIHQMTTSSKTLEMQSVPSNSHVKQHQSSPLKNSSLHEKETSIVQKPMDTIKSRLDIQEIHQFIRDLFQNSFGTPWYFSIRDDQIKSSTDHLVVMNKPPFRATRIRLKW